MTNVRVTTEDFPARWHMFGGRGLSARILTEECTPQCEPLGPENILALVPGVLSGTAAPTSGRLSVGCKSPLTGGIKEASAGGNAAQHLVKLGYRAIIVSGQPADREKRWGLVIDTDGVRLQDATDYAGMWNYPTCKKLLANYPATASAICIGPAGELMLKAASVACTDKDKARRPTRHAARGGPGAVMGSKCLKWIVIDPGNARVRQPADPKTFRERCRAFSKDYLATRHHFFKYGTSAGVPFANAMHTFPYRNRIAGQNPHADRLDGARIQESFEQRGGGMHSCLTGCIVRCSNVVHDKDGNYKTSALEFETLALLGSCCDINDWEQVAELDRLCDELGLDTIETGAALAVLMDSGGMDWGDADGAIALLQSITQRDESGLDICNGALHVGSKRDHHRIPHGKGQALAAWDPRPLKSVGITYSSSAMGADHTAGFVMELGQSDEEALIASQEEQIINAVCDSSGLCSFMQPTLDEIRGLYAAFHNEEVDRERIANLGWVCLTDEWAFNDAAGFTAADDDLPTCVRDEGVGPEGTLTFQVPVDVIARVKVRQPARERLFIGGSTGGV